MVNEPNAGAVMLKRLILPFGYFILIILISLPVMRMKMENLPLVIDLAVLSSTFAATSLLFYYKPHFCINECGKWLPPFNTSIVAALCFMILLWALADMDYNVRAPMAMMLFSMATFFSMSEGTHLWKLMGE